MAIVIIAGVVVGPIGGGLAWAAGTVPPLPWRSWSARAASTRPNPRHIPHDSGGPRTRVSLPE
ncbi:hypothetical protein ACIBHX_23220 [Nonomuraea sp. NPDC050536]|uniref:hypothetical protein n=1 Tax=Nonomuraea sp. NPDC050536 TaxID=3364366 RepID=UPI0037C553DD